jgi:hypothetical protein
VAYRRLYPVLAARSEDAAKKLIKAVGESIDGEGGQPWELFEWDIIRETGWTQAQLDDADIARLFTGISLSNIRTALENVNAWIEHKGRVKIPARSWTIWKMVKDLDK